MNQLEAAQQRAKLRQVVLRSFACPFAVGDASPCLLLDSMGCPFGHPGSAGTSTPLRALPSYVCVDYLLDRHTKQSPGINFATCVNGLHPELEDLISLDRLHTKMAVELIAHGYEPKSLVPVTISGAQLPALSTPEPDDHQCGVCLEQIAASGRDYGLLEHCTHAFCAVCLAECRDRDRPDHDEHLDETGLKCPMCRVVSRRVLLWPTYLASAEAKKRHLDLLDRANAFDRCLDGHAHARNAMQAPSTDSSDSDEATDEEVHTDRDDPPSPEAPAAPPPVRQRPARRALRVERTMRRAARADLLQQDMDRFQIDPATVAAIAQPFIAALQTGLRSFGGAMAAAAPNMVVPPPVGGAAASASGGASASALLSDIPPPPNASASGSTAPEEDEYD